MTDDFTKRRTEYEWVVEVLEGDDAILDVLAFDSREDAERCAEAEPLARVALRRVSGSHADGVDDMRYAYVLPDGSLPEQFEEGGDVPARFREARAQ
jgi:hypothetical protein